MNSMMDELPNPVNPSIEKQIYHDNWFDQLFIRLFASKMARAIGQTSQLAGYDAFVDLSKQIMRGRTPQEQQAVVAQVLRSLVPSPILAGIRRLFAPTQWVCEWNAWFATVLFEWLVGPCEVREVNVTDPEGQPRTQKSGVHIKKCRYLEQAGCVGMCINMCKLPTQAFFTEGFGIPLAMTPNFEDLSCEMVFGQMPLPLTDEPLSQHPCLKSRCAMADPTAAVCPNI